MGLSLNELNIASFNRRLFARHYPYFDEAALTTLTGYNEDTALAAAQANLAATPVITLGNTYYQFGRNTRNKIVNILTSLTAGNQNWPVGCYGREILLYCTQNAHISFIVINPQYLTDYTRQLATGNQQRAVTSQLLYEKEFYLPAEDYKRRFLYYGYGVIFRADTVSGTLYIDIEASVTGDES